MIPVQACFISLYMQNLKYCTYCKMQINESRTRVQFLEYFFENCIYLFLPSFIFLTRSHYISCQQRTNWLLQCSLNTYTHTYIHTFIHYHAVYNYRLQVSTWTDKHLYHVHYCTYKGNLLLKNCLGQINEGCQTMYHMCIPSISS